MHSFLRAPFSTLVTLITGLVVLLGYFLDIAPLGELRARFLHWGVILAAVALVLGVFNLLRVHWNRFREGTKKALYSFAFFCGFFCAFLAGELLGVQHSLTRAIVDFVVVPIEASLFVIILIALIYALTRLLYNRFTLFNAVFLITVLVSLLGSVPLLGAEIPLLQGRDSLLSFTTRIMGTGGMRGLIIGVALGSIISGIRVLLGMDRPYGE
ncbi:MAG: hypothetical protein Kow0088_21480 [Anaerolineales bacterium]